MYVTLYGDKPIIQSYCTNFIMYWTVNNSHWPFSLWIMPQVNMQQAQKNRKKLILPLIVRATMYIYKDVLGINDMLHLTCIIWKIDYWKKKSWKLGKMHNFYKMLYNKKMQYNKIINNKIMKHFWMNFLMWNTKDTFYHSSFKNIYVLLCILVQH